MADLGEFRGGCGADLLGWALLADEGWETPLQRLDTLPQLVVIRVGDFRLVFLVIELVMPLQLAARISCSALASVAVSSSAGFSFLALCIKIVLHYRTCRRRYTDLAPLTLSLSPWERER